MIYHEKLSTILQEAEAMVGALEEYLLGDKMFKQLIVHTSDGDRLPEMTLGGLLERVRHLDRFKERLASDEKERLDAVQERIEDARFRHKDRYAHWVEREFKGYLDSWHWYMDDVLDGDSGALDRYPQEVRIRDRLDLLIQEAGKVGVSLPTEKLEEEDKRLRSVWQKGKFLWIDDLRPFYPPERYWWLYGRPVVEDS